MAHTCGCNDPKCQSSASMCQHHSRIQVASLNQYFTISFMCFEQCMHYLHPWMHNWLHLNLSPLIQVKHGCFVQIDSFRWFPSYGCKWNKILKGDSFTILTRKRITSILKKKRFLLASFYTACCFCFFVFWQSAAFKIVLEAIIWMLIFYLKNKIMLKI
jgi:hypothetical protein